MTSTFIVQIASVPGNQVGQRQFEQNRYLHELLLSLLTNEDEENKADKEQIHALRKIVPEHEIILRSGFSQTARWGLEPNMFLKIHGDENQARMISALFGEAFCQDGIGIGIGDGTIEGQDHSVLIINREWTNEDERLDMISMILQQYPTLSAQLDVNNQIAFHDYSMSSSTLFPEIIALLGNTNGKYLIEEKQMKSDLVDRTEYDTLLMSLRSSHTQRIVNDLKRTHARLFSGYGCGSFTLPIWSRRGQKKRREQRKDLSEKNRRQSLVAPSHLCSLIFTSRRPCMCLTDNNCFCHYTLVLTTHLTPELIN